MRCGWIAGDSVGFGHGDASSCPNEPVADASPKTYHLASTKAVSTTLLAQLNRGQLRPKACVVRVAVFSVVDAPNSRAEADDVVGIIGTTLRDGACGEVRGTGGQLWW